MAINTITQLDKFDNGEEESGSPSTSASRPIGKNLCYYEYSDNNYQVTQAAYTSIQTPKSRPKDLSVYNEETFWGSYFEISRPKNKTSTSKPDPETNSKFYSEKISYEQLMKNFALDIKTLLDHTNNLGNINLCALAGDNYIFDGNKTFLSSVAISGNLDVKGDTNLCSKLRVSSDVTFDSNLTVNGHQYIDKWLKVQGNISGFGDIYGISNLYITENITATNGYFSNELSAQTLTATILSASNGTIVNFTSTTAGISNLTANTLNVLTSIATPEIYVNKIHKYPSEGDDPIICTTGINFCGNGLTAGECDLTALHARWSDLAEYYHSDEKYEPGTLVKFGGEKELTIADTDVNAVVTSKPAYLMNNSLKDEDGVAIALVGRIPVKMIGKIKKFDKITLSDSPGIGISKKWYQFWKKTIGISLENNFQEDVKLVECIVQLKM